MIILILFSFLLFFIFIIHYLRIVFGYTVDLGSHLSLESLSLDLSSEGESNEDEAHPPIAPAEEVQPVEKQSRTM